MSEQEFEEEAGAAMYAVHCSNYNAIQGMTNTSSIKCLTQG